MHLITELMADLENMGINPTDTLLVHSSMKSIGEVENGADGVLEALMAYLSEGLLVMPALTWSSVNAQSPEFYPERTPAVVGILPELFRRKPGVVRSWHPTHSVVAFGRDAASFVAGHERFETPCARHSPWGRIVERNGKILFIGTGIMCNTMLHGAEEWFGVSGAFTAKPENLTVVTSDGRRIEVKSFRHAGGRSKYYAKMETLFFSAGAMKTGIFGDAQCRLAFARPMIELTLSALKADPDLFGHEDMPDIIV